MKGLFNFLKRPALDTQNTGRDVYDPAFGVATVAVQGNGGANNYRSLGPFNPAGFNPQLAAYSSVTGQGSPNSINANPQLMPLIDKGNSPGPQF